MNAGQDYVYEIICSKCKLDCIAVWVLSHRAEYSCIFKKGIFKSASVAGDFQVY